MEWAASYVGSAHITVTSTLGKHDQIPERLVQQLADTENVELVTPRLLLRRSCRLVSAERLSSLSGASLTWSSTDPEVDLHGIDLDTELVMRGYPLSAGRMLTKEDGFACVLEAGFARQEGIQVGDCLLVWDQSEHKPFQFEIVGLFDRHRVGKLQKPLALVPLAVLQRATLKYALVSTIDVKLKDASRAALQKAGARIRAKVKRAAGNARVRSAAARMQQVELAQNNQQLVLVMLGSVAMLTALFIILSTLSMGLLERIRQLGLLRCVGMTRIQLAGLVLAEVIPLGIIGVAVGVPVGLGLTAATVWLVPEYVGSFLISWRGVLLASLAGIATTIAAGLLPALAMLRVSPLESARPRASRPRGILLVLAGGLAALVLAWQHFVAVEKTVRDVNFLSMAAIAVILLYAGYALLAPVIVRLIGSPAVVAAAGLLRVRTRLLQDQVGYAVWRSAGICCGLMVGLSLIVGIVVVNESVSRGWQFPKQFPAAFMWCFGQLPPDTADQIAEVPGVGEFTVANSVNVIVEERPLIGERLLRSVTWFMGVEPDGFFDLVKLEFLEGEGDEQTARRLLKQGGHVVIADDFSRSRNKHVGDTVKVLDERTYRWHRFKVAGVVRSPALDLAASYFQLLSEYTVAASGSVMGTNEDLKRRFGINGANLALLNFDLPDQPVPPDWPPPPGAQAGELPERYYDTSAPLARRWQRWREEQVLQDLRRKLRDPSVRTGSVAELKDEIDSQLTGMIGLLSAIPSLALLVAALGVANLTTANVTARAKQLAILRAVGATRGLVLRMVIGEALVLGLLGSALGLALGLHLAADITDLVDRMWGFRVALDMPWRYVIATILLTVGLCALAGILPARHASRANIVDALHVT
jgi:putative ABC transport system permease protein